MNSSGCSIKCVCYMSAGTAATRMCQRLPAKAARRGGATHSSQTFVLRHMIIIGLNQWSIRVNNKYPCDQCFVFCVQHCISYIIEHLDVANACAALQTCVEADAFYKQRDAALHYIANNARAVICSKHFLQLKEDAVCEILDSNEVRPPATTSIRAPTPSSLRIALFILFTCSSQSTRWSSSTGYASGPSPMRYVAAASQQQANCKSI